MSKLKDKLLVVVLKVIRDDLWIDYEGRVRLGCFASVTSVSSENQRILSAVLRLGVISEEVLSQAVHARLCIYGREMLARVVEDHEYPDHVGSPPALAYALCYDDVTRSIVGAGVSRLTTARHWMTTKLGQTVF